MTPATLLGANLTRRKTRAFLTLAALAVAFLLFMLLRAIAGAFAGGVTPDGLERFVVDSKYSMTENLPLAYVERIRTLDAVDEVAHMTWFAGYVREPRNSFSIYPVDPRPYFDVMNDQRIAPQALERFAATRNGAVASAALARRFGWRVGEVIPLESRLYPKSDGSTAWPLTLVGTFDYADGQDTELLLFQYEHYNESAASWARNQVYWMVARASSADRVNDAIAMVDAEFENSSYPTRSTPEDEYRRQFAGQLGDMGSIATTILGAVFFTLVLLTGNTVMQAYRERIPELGVMKTLGFSDSWISSMLLAESVLLCVTGGLAGIALAFLLEPGMNADLGNFVGRFRITLTTAAQAVGIAALLGVLVGLPPAWAAFRRPIVDALREG